MSEKFIIQPGKICTFDVKNILNKDETSIITVEVLESVPKKNLFGPRWWKIVGAGDDFIKLPNPIECPETLLSPSGMCILRYPSDTPVINSNDIKILTDIIKLLEDPNPMTRWTNINTISTEKSINRIKALKEKLEFSMKLRDV